MSDGFDASVRAARAPERPSQIRAAIASLLDRDDVLVLDTETTGMGDSEVIEVSVIDTTGAVRLDTLVRPKTRTMNPYAQRVHGITLPMLDGAPTWPEVLPELTRLVDRATVLAWNAPFDRRMLDRSCAVWGLDAPRALFVCAMRMYARMRGIKPRALHKVLVDLELGHLTETHRSHRALGDAHFVLAILRASAD